MAQLTPLSKGLITLIVIGGGVSLAWHNGLKDKFGGYLPGSAPKPPPATQTASAPAPVVATPAPATTAPPPAEVRPPPPPAEVKPAPAAKAAPGINVPPKQAFEEGRRALDAGDHARARQLLEAALKGGEAGAGCLLGEMTLAGQGGFVVDRDKAAEFYRIAQSKNIICFGANR